MGKSIIKQTGMIASWITVVALTNAGPVSASMELNTLSAESREAIEAIRKESTEPTRFVVDEGLRQVTRARFDIWAPSRLGGDTAEAANWIVQRNRSLLRGVGLADLSDPLVQGAPGDLVSAVYLQRYQRLPVEGAGVVVHMLDRSDHIEIIGIDNWAAPDLDLDSGDIIANGISLQDALDAIAAVKIDEFRVFGTPTLLDYRLVIAFAKDSGDGSSLAERARVAFRILATSGENTYLFWVDVESGEVLRFANYVQEDSQGPPPNYSRDVKVFDGNGSESQSQWSLAYENSSSNPDSSSWDSEGEYLGIYNSVWFSEENPYGVNTRAPLRDVPRCATFPSTITCISRKTAITASTPATSRTISNWPTIQQEG
jgi:hypothetical protein